MDIHPRQSPLIFLLVCGFILLCVIIGLLVPSLVRADVGVQPILPGGSNIQPEGETPIQMGAEKVTINVRLATESDNALVKLNPDAYGLQIQPVWFTAIAEVEAEFLMNNPTIETVSMTAWFPLASALENVGWELNPDEIVPRIESFQVSVDGNPVDYSVSELPNPKGVDKPPLPWASFPVTFPGDKETVIDVSYVLPLQPSIKGNEMALYYIFQTGAGWAGSIGQAELILNLPYPGSVETLAGMPSGSLQLPPYYIPKRMIGLPPGAVLEGNQARWTWKDFDPDPEDDFAVWLIQPGKWQELETARAEVQANPEDGHAWLNLASTYYSMSFTDRLSPLIFNPSYLPLAIEAYQKAAALLPEHPVPHAGLALLTLAPYMSEKNAPQEVIQFVQDEFQIARELDAMNPSLAIEAGISRWMMVWLEDVLSIYFHDVATATVQSTAWSTDWSKEPAETVFQEIPSATPNKKLTLTATPIPTTTPQPAPKTAQTTGNGQSLGIIVAAGVIGLVIVGFLAVKRLRKSSGK